MSRLVDSPTRIHPRPRQPERELAKGLPEDQAPAPAPAPPDTLSDYLERISKYVPVEILAAFMAIRGYVSPQGAMPPELEIALFAILVALTPFYLLKVGGDVPQRTLQVAIATMSFVIWAYAIGGNFFWGAVAKLAGVPVEQIVYPAFAGALVVIWSLGVGLVRPIEKQSQTR